MIYYKISFKRTFNSLLDVALFITIGGLIASLFGFYHSGFFMRNIVEAGMLIGAFAGSIVKTLALIFQLMQEKKI